VVSVDALAASAEAFPGGDSPAEGLRSLPALADPHVHLDKALTIELVANPAGDLAGAIEAWLAFRNRQTKDQIRERARRGALAFLLSGATALRAHVDTGPDIGVRAVEALLEVRGELAGLLDLQIVACASLPVSGLAGRETRAVAAEALAIGADVVGGAPYLDDDPASAYDELVNIALDAGAGLDLHVDETLAPGVFTLPLLIERVEAGFPHPVAADHVVSLAVQPEAIQRQTADRLASARIGVVVLPATNLYLQGRGPATPSARGITAIRALLDAGVTVAAGADNVRDPFNPTGRFDPLETASLLVTAGHLEAEEALAAVSRSARSLLGLNDSTRSSDSAANTVRLRGESLADVIAAAPPERTVIRAGRVVARTTVQTWVAEEATA
jgi:cytosine/creatinine deaminase